MSIHNTTVDIDGHIIKIETGLFGAQAAGCVTVSCCDTVVLGTAVSSGPKEGLDYFPLTVEYREKHYAGGIISSSRYVKREGRPADNEILTSRLIDRSIRPLFPSNYFDDVQVMVSPLSIDGQNEPEILGIIAASAALAISDLPWSGPVGAVRIGMDAEGKLIANPTADQKSNSKLDLVVSGGTGSIAMVEAGASEVSESEVLKALKYGQEKIEILVDVITKFAKEVGKTKKVVLPEEFPAEMVKLVNDKINVASLLKDSKAVGGEGLKLGPIIDSLCLLDPELDRNKVARLIDDKIKEHIRDMVLNKGERFDGRKSDQIRSLTATVGVLPRVHGSGFFQRGMTHVLSIVTLGSPSAEQTIDGMKGVETKRYIHHYNMPGYATGESGRVGNPGRREIGHGALAERALMPVLPSKAEFPYTIRVVSEVMSGNGSTSQASVCGSTLSLMDAGVPIKKPVAGIAMGLITKEGKEPVTLSDIAGLEDHFGDMDFKVAGTSDGITALQMDVKILGVTASILEKALAQALVGRQTILAAMNKAIETPRATVSTFAPKVATVQIPQEKIGELIGPGGKMIRQIQAEFEVEINVEETGFVVITGIDLTKVTAAREFVAGLTAEAEVGKIYNGTVTRVESYGAFVEVLPGQDGLVHVSRMSTEFVDDANNILKVGDKVDVKCYEVDDQGRINLTMLLNDEKPTGRPERSERPRQDFKSHFRDRR